MIKIKLAIIRHGGGSIVYADSTEYKKVKVRIGTTDQKFLEQVEHLVNDEDWEIINVSNGAYYLKKE